MKHITKILILTIGLSSCASMYHPIEPRQLNYNAHDLQQGISFSYKFDVLAIKGNKKYSKKEHSEKIKIVAIKITNNTDTLINFSNDLTFYSDDKEIQLIDPIIIKDKIKQNALDYLPWALLTFLKLEFTSTTNGMITNREVYRIGLVAGPLVMGSNMIAASNANKNFNQEILEYNLWNLNIPSGETVYGLIGFYDDSYNPLTVKIKN